MGEGENLPTNRQRFEDTGVLLDPIAWGVDPASEGYLLEACQNLGWCSFAGMGTPVPISWSEIKAYNDLADGMTDPWEFQAIRDISSAYVMGNLNGGHLTQRPGCSIRGF